MAAQPDAALAVQAALAFLRLHSWWEGVEARLPRRLAALGNALFAFVGEPACQRVVCSHHRVTQVWNVGKWCQACPCTRHSKAPSIIFMPRAERSATGAAQHAPAQPHHASTLRRGWWPHVRSLLSPGALFDALDDLFELGDNLDLTVGGGLGWGAVRAGGVCARPNC
jgi:hypothetical protein